LRITLGYKFEINLLRGLSSCELTFTLLSKFLCSFIFWTVFRSSAWKLIDLHLESNFLIFVLTNHTNWIVPSCDVVRDSIYFPWSCFINRNSIEVWSLTIRTHHRAFCNWTFGGGIIDKEICGNNCRILRLGFRYKVKFNLLWFVYSYKLSSARLLYFFGSFIFWTVIRSSAWKLIYLKFNTNFLILVFADDTNRILPSKDVVRYSIYFPWSCFINRNSI